MTQIAISKYAPEANINGVQINSIDLDGTKINVMNYKRNSHGDPIDPASRRVRGWFVDEDGNRLLTSFPYVDQRRYNDDLDNTKSYRFFPQGVMIRVWSFNGKIQFSSNKAFDAHSSWYGNQKNKFVDLLLKHASMTEEELEAWLQLEPGVMHMFVVCDPQIMTTFQGPTQDGFLYYVGAFSCEHMMPMPEKNRLCPVMVDLIDPFPVLEGIVAPIHFSFEMAEGVVEGFVFDDPMSVLEICPCVEFVNDERVLIEYARRVVPMVDSVKETVVDNQYNFHFRMCEMVSESFNDYIFTSMGLNPVNSLENKLELLTLCVTRGRQQECVEAAESFTNKRDEMFEFFSTHFSTIKAKINTIKVPEPDFQKLGETVEWLKKILPYTHSGKDLVDQLKRTYGKHLYRLLFKVSWEVFIE